MRCIMFFLKKQRVSWTVHKNPDGTDGGRVADTAKIGRNVTIKKTARVLPNAEVPDDTIVELGVMYTHEGPVKFTL